ncbi:hypothetical protein ACOSP7_026423 [Xanthoceras sorbifolium]
MFQDAKEVASNCEKCQRIADNIRQPLEKLRITSPWPFAQWGIDLIGPMLTATGQAKYAIVAVDYFTKWAEAEPLVRITEQNTTDFVKKSIIYRFGVPDTIISDNGTQFDNLNFPDFCQRWGIRNHYASVAHPQTNGQLPEVLWAYRTTARTSTSETPFTIAFGVETVIPIKMRIQSPRVAMYDPVHNISALETSLDELESLWDRAQIRNAMYQQRVAWYYNSKVRERRFQLNNLVLRRVSLNTKGPYRIIEQAGHGYYRIA